MAEYKNIIKNEVVIDGREEINRLTDRLVAAREEIDRLNSALEEAYRKVGDLENGDVGILQSKINELKETISNFTRQSVAEFRAFLQSVNLDSEDYRFSDLFSGLDEGFITASQAITRVKMEYGELLADIHNNSGGLLDSQIVQGITASLERLGNTISNIETRINNIEQNGVKSIGEAGSVDVANVLSQIENAARGMSEEVKGSYESITSLVNAMNEYANLDSTRILGVSQAFKNIADIGKGSYGTKSIENIVYLTRQLQALSASGSSIRFDFTGFNNLKVSKASVSNLATYLPQIASVNVSKLEKLSQVNLTNFNNVKVSKSTIENISRLTEAIQVLKEVKAASVKADESSIDITGGEIVKQDTSHYKDATNAVKEYYNTLLRLRKSSVDVRNSITLGDKGYVVSPNATRDVDEFAAALNRTKAAFDLYTNAENQSKMTDEERINLRRLLASESEKYAISSETQANKEIESAEKAARKAEEKAEREKAAAEKAADAREAAAQRAADKEIASEARRQEASKMSSEQIESNLLKIEKLSLSLKNAINNAETLGVDSEGLDRLRTLESELETLRANTANGSVTNQDFANSLKNIQLAADVAGVAVKQESKDIRSILIPGTKEFGAARQELARKMTQAQNALRKFTAAEKSGNETSRIAYGEIQNAVKGYKQLSGQFIAGNLSRKDFDSGINNLSASVTENTRIIRENGDAHQTVGEKVKGAIAKFSQWFGVTRIVMAAYRAMKQMVSAVIEVDTAMTELRKVTEETEEIYNKFLTNAAQRAKVLGASLTDVINASADFARLGYSLEESSRLADTAIVYKNVGDGIQDIGEASESIISTMKAFGIETENSMNVVDKFNEVGNNFAISSKGVGDALVRSASAMHAANNTLDETIALITTANTIVQNPDSVGTSMKTLSMYLRAAKTEAEDAGESTEGMADSISELRGEILSLTGNKVDIQIDEDNFKSTYQIIKELSSVWSELTDISKANILELIGGKRNSNVVSALIENFEIAERVLETSANASGSALAENEKYLQSIEGRIKTFKATFEELSQNIIQGDLVKDVVDTGTWFLGFLNKLSGVSNILGKIIDALGGIKGLIAIISSYLVVSKFDAIISRVNTAKIFLAEMIPFIQAFVVANGGLIGSIKALTAAWAASPFGIVTAVIAGIVLIANAIDYFTVSAKEAAEALEESKQAYSEAKSELVELSDKLETTSERIEELEKLKDAGSLSFTEEEELNNLKAQNAELQRSIDLLEIKTKMKAKEQNSAFINAMSKDLEQSDEFAFSETNGYDNRGNSSSGITESEYINRQFTKYKSIAKQLSDLENEYSSKLNDEASRKQYEKEKQRLDDQLRDIETYLTSKSDSLGSLSDGIEYIDNPTTDDERAVNEWLDFIEDFQDKMAIALGGDNAKTNAFNRLLDNWKFDEVTDDLKSLGEAGLVTAEMLNNPAYSDFINKLVELGVISDKNENSLQSVALAFNSYSESAKVAANSTNDVSDKVSNLKDTIDTLDEAKSGIEALKTAVNELNNDGAVSFSSLKSINDAFGSIEGIESYISALSKVKKGSKEAADIFNELAYTYIKLKVETNELTEENEMLIASMLEEAGVENSLAVAQEMVSDAQSGVIYSTKISKEEYDKLDSSIKKLLPSIKESGDAYIIESRALEALGKSSEAVLKAIALSQSGMTDVTFDNVEQRLKALQKEAEAYQTFATTLASYSTVLSSISPAASKTAGEFADLLLKSADPKSKEAYEQYQKFLEIYSEFENLKDSSPSIDWEEVESKSKKSEKEAETWFERQYKDHQHMVNMEQETDAQYLAWLEAAYQKAYDEGIITLDEYYKYQEEVYKGYKSLGDGAENWFEKQQKEHQHLVNMQQESDEQYLKWLDGAYKSAYSQGLISLDDYRKYQEEVFNGMQSAFKDYLNDIEHEISMAEGVSKDSKKVLSLYKQLISAVEKEIKAARAKGLSDTDDYIQDLQSKLLSYQKSIEDLEDNVKSTVKSSVDNLVDIRVKMLKQDVQNEKDAIDKKIKYLQDFYNKQKEMLQDQYDEEKYLAEQNEKRNAVSKLQSEIEKLRFDDSAWAQKRRLELAQELANAQRELDEFEKEKALERTQDELDKQLEMQKDNLDEQSEILESKLNDAGTLYRRALSDIKTGSVQLYQEMIQWNSVYGDGISDTIKSAWEDAYKALQEYKSLYGTLYEGVDLQNVTGYVDTSISTSASTGTGLYKGGKSTLTHQYRQDTSSLSSTTTSAPSVSYASTSTPKASTSTSTSSSVSKVLTYDEKRKVAAAIWDGTMGWGTDPDRAKKLTEVFGANNGIQALVDTGVGKNDARPSNDYTYLNMRKKYKGYASGTKNATAGFHTIDEFGTETIFESIDGTRYKMFTGGEKVLNAKASNFLYDFATKGNEILSRFIKSIFGSETLGKLSPALTSNEINMGDIIIQGGANEKTISEIRREQRSSVEYMLKQLGRLQK